MSYSNRPIRGKRTMLVLCCGLVFGMANGQQSQTFNYTGSMQNWTVPAGTNQITITAIGATGGINIGYTPVGGKGAKMTGTFTVTPGAVLKVLVGGVGQNGSGGGGGGGGTFVTSSTNNPMIIAGGGGGVAAFSNSYSSVGIDAVTTTSGVNGYSTLGGSPNNYGVGGVSGSGATNFGPGNGPCGGNAGGLLSNGTAYSCCGTNTYGYAFVNGGAGGVDNVCYANGVGGYGGGGSGASSGGGGGGGYSGGGGSWNNPTNGGGGGSYNGGTNQTNTAAFNAAGSGQVTITYGISVNVRIINVLCFGGNTGSVVAIASGISPFTYSWAPVAGSTDSIGGVSAGTYTVTVTQSGGGSASVTAVVIQPASAISVSAGTITNVLCNGGNNGSLSSFTSGGTSPYTYLWAPAGGTAHTASGLTAGTYTLTATDKHGCTASASTTITQPNALLVSANVSANVSCHGGADGSASSSVTFGTTPYTYFWSNAITASAISGLTAGTYSLHVTDNNGCTGSGVVTIAQPATFVASASVVSNVLCYGGNNGSASSNVNGGTPPYNYYWSDGETNVNAAALSAGTFTVTTTDNCGSSATVLVTVTQPAALGGTATVVENVNCNGASNGCASVSTSGGTPPYAYQWSDVNNQVTPTACGLSAGTYTVSITDNNGCKGAVSATITQPSSISVSATSSIDRGNCNGGASVSVSGGVAPYSYAWANGGTTNAISNQCGGAIYCCTVTDAMGCQQNACVTIKKLSTGIANVNGGTEGITVYPNPNNGQFTIQSSVTGGQWSVEVYNALGEKVYSTFNIQNPTLDINLSNQPDGVYLYRVMSEDGSLLGEGKVVLQK